MPIATIPDALARWALDGPDEVALVIPPWRLTASQLMDRATSAAADLSRRGVGPGDHVAILAPNCVQFVDYVVATGVLGAVVVPLNTRSEPPEVARAIDHAELTAVVTVPPEDPERDLVAIARDGIALSSSGAELIVARTHPDQGGAVSHGSRPTTRRRTAAHDETKRDVAALLYTSGTTSAPKGCLLSHEAIIRNGTARLVERRTEPDTAVWTPCPLFHVGALLPLVGCIATRTTFVTTRRFDAGDTLRLLEVERVTTALPLFPAFTDALLDHPALDDTDLSHLRQFLSSGPPRGLRRAQQRFAPAKLMSAYGMTEICGVASSSRPDDTDQQRLEWHGHPFDDTEIEIADPETGELVGPGVVGELVARGYFCFEGYYRDPEATRRSIDERGWFHTGDMGRRDDAGRVAYLGRFKDMLKVGGENVAALEVESFLGSYEGVRRAEVVGAPDPRLVEVVAAFVELEQGACVSSEELIGYCKGRLARFKIPRYVVFVDSTEWPMSATKVDKVALRDRLTRRLATEGGG